MKKRQKHIRTLGDKEQELKIRDKKLKQEAKSKAVNAHLDPGRSRLDQILELKYNQCATCKKKLPLKSFNTIYRSDKTLKKIWPSCKKCTNAIRKALKYKASKQKILDCFSRYGLYTRICCSECLHEEFNSLTLLDKQYKTREAILTSAKYKWLYEHNFIKLNIKLVCYNCAFKYINKHSKR